MLVKSLLLATTVITISCNHSVADKKKRLEANQNPTQKSTQASVGTSKTAQVEAPWSQRPTTPMINHFFPTSTAKTNQAPLCSQISDQFCRRLWDKDHKGNLQFGPHNIYYGLSHDRASSEIDRLNTEALILAKDRLPQDIQAVVTPLIEQLKQHLQVGADTTQWRHKLELLTVQINQQLYQVAEARAFVANPTLKTLPEEDREITHRMEIKKYVLAVQNQVLDAKYLHHKNWLRTKKLFNLAKSLLLKSLKALDLASDTKNLMMDQLKKTELTLPYGEIKKLGASHACRTYAKNAYYYPRLNRLTLCAGYFNGLQSDASLFSILAHELAHATDASMLASLHYKASKMAKALNEVALNEGQLSCSRWEKINKSVFVAPKKIFDLPENLIKLNECHVDRSKLKPLTVKSLAGPSATKARRKTTEKARRYDFSKVILPAKLKYGEEVPNPYYLRPHLLDASRNENQMPAYRSGYFYFPALFLQNYKCKAEKHKTTISRLAANKPVRTKLFEASLHATQQQYKVYNQTRLSYYGRESSELRNYKLSKVSYEDWADWLSFQALNLYLKQMPSLAEKRWSILSVTSRRCTRTDLSILAPHITQAERSFSNSKHSLKRTRRLRVFTELIANQLQCSRSELKPTCQLAPSKPNP